MLELQREVWDAEAYIQQNLKPCIEQFLRHVRRNEENSSVAERQWSWCDMMFTAFLGSASMRFVDRNHDLYMSHMQAWFRALSRAEGQIPRPDLHRPARVRDAEMILKAVEETRPDSYTTIFDQNVFEKGRACNKEYKLFCLCLSYIVHRDCGDLGTYSDEWDETVVCGWFDEDNTEAARAFVLRAEAFFDRIVGVMLMSKYAKLRRGFLHSPAINRAAGNIAIAAPASEYLVRRPGGFDYSLMPADVQAQVRMRTPQWIARRRQRRLRFAFTRAMYRGPAASAEEHRLHLAYYNAFMSFQAMKETWYRGTPESLIAHTRDFRQLIDEVFVLKPADDGVNLSAAEWRQVNLRFAKTEIIHGPSRMAEVTLEGGERAFVADLDDCSEQEVAVGARGRHRISVVLPCLFEENRARFSWLHIYYEGFLSFQSFADARGTLVKVPTAEPTGSGGG